MTPSRLWDLSWIVKLQVTLVFQKGVEGVAIQQKSSTLRIMQVNLTDLKIWTWGERYKDMTDHRSYHELCTRLNPFWKWRLKRNSGLNGIRTHDLCDSSAVLYQSSCQTNWELVSFLTFLVPNIPFTYYVVLTTSLLTNTSWMNVIISWTSYRTLVVEPNLSYVLVVLY